MAHKYLKVAAIGSGTFGEAWLVTSNCSGRNYVVKEIMVGDMTEEEYRRVQSEVAVLERCKHANIIRYKETFAKPNPASLCLVMEYADGGDLNEKVKDAKMQSRMIREEYVMHWFIQIMFAVQYLHSNNILHRDLKTQNIFLTQTDMVKVGDFGIARFVRNNQDLATTAIGTPYYLSPEICLRRPYNHKSDMWAIGCILYELCSLRHPFEAENFESLIVIILQGNYRLLSLYYSNVIHKLIQVLLRGDPDSRPSADLLLTAPALKPHVRNYMTFHDKLINSSQESLRPCSRSSNIAEKSIIPSYEGILCQQPVLATGGKDYFDVTECKSVKSRKRKRIFSNNFDENMISKTSDYDSKSDSTDSPPRRDSGTQTSLSDSVGSIDSNEYTGAACKTAESCAQFASKDDVFAESSAAKRKKDTMSPLCKTFVVRKMPSES